MGSKPLKNKMEIEEKVFGEPDTKIEDKTSTESEEDKKSETEEEKNKEPDKKDEEDKKSAIAQKKYWREKFNDLKKELDELKSPKKTSNDEDAEAKAKKYISDVAKEAIEEFTKSQKAKEEKALEQFEDELEDTLEANPDVKEDVILDICEKLKVSPQKAVEVLKLTAVKKKEPPKMPSSQRGTPISKETHKDDKDKSMWQIAQDAINKAKEQGL